MSEPMLFTYAAACGFVWAALLATGYQLVTSRPARFEMLFGAGDAPFFSLVFQAVLVVWAAPYIIMRNALRGRFIEHRPLGWLFASFGVATLWSACVGVLVLSFALSVS